jgi:hypothetical protein
LSYRGHRLRITAAHAETTIAASPCDAQPVTVRVGDHLVQISGGQVATIGAADGDRLAEGADEDPSRSSDALRG